MKNFLTISYQNLVWRTKTYAFLTSSTIPPTICRLTFLSGVIFFYRFPTPPPRFPIHSDYRSRRLFLKSFSWLASFIARTFVRWSLFCVLYLNDNNKVLLFSQFNFSVKDIFHERAWLMSSVFSVQVSGLQSNLCKFNKQRSLKFVFHCCDRSKL